MLSRRLAHDDRRQLFLLCSFVLVCSLLLGGGTRGGFLSDAILELLAIPLFLMSLASLLKTLHGRQFSHSQLAWPLLLCGAIAFIPLIQLVPLPPGIWTNLPNRGRELVLLDLIDHGRPWMPISTSPTSTWLSALSLLPPFAIFFSTIQLGYRERRLLSLVIILIGFLSAFVGLLQIAQGPSSPLRFFLVTNDKNAVGFFANRNHFGALLYVVLLFAIVWAIDGISWQGYSDLNSAVMLRITSIFLILVLLMVTQTMTGSRAGLIFTMIALISTFGLTSVNRSGGSGITPSKFILGATILVIILAIQFSLYRIVGRFSAETLQDARIPIAHNTIAAAKAFMPFGAGVGTFMTVYGLYESPQTMFANTYANHAHNDILEVWLETGVAGVVITGLLILWIVLKSRIWWKRPTNARGIDHSLAKAGIIAIGLLIAHSFVDYPLRTGALEAIFAFVCALLVTPPAGCESIRGVQGSVEAGAGWEKSETSEPTIAYQRKSSPKSIRRSTADIDDVSMRRSVEHRKVVDWSEQWRKRVERDPPSPDLGVILGEKCAEIA